MNRYPFLLITLLLTASLSGCQSDPSKDPRLVVDPVDTQPKSVPLLASGPIVSADPAETLARGEHYYQTSCASCHDSGAGGTPKLGDVAEWKPRIAQGLDTLVHHAIEGYGGSACAMPPRGGHPDLQIEAVALAVRYMIEMSLPEKERRLPGL